VRVLVTGASGMVGRAVVHALLGRGDQVVALSRDPGRHPWPAGARPVAWDAASPLPAAIGAVDAVVNLAGQSVVGGRWTVAYRSAMRDSRIGVTRRLVEWGRTLPMAPPLVSASAAGYYGDHPAGPLAESAPAGSGPLAELARDWEAEARRWPGRLVVFRLGHVLSTEGGYLGTLLPYARRHLAGRVGSGRQPMAWVHLADVANAFLWAIERRDGGTFNVASPGAAGCTQAEFARAVAQAVGKPLQVPVPVALLKLRYGRGAGPALGGGQDLRSDALVAADFQFQWTDLESALADLLG